MIAIVVAACIVAAPSASHVSARPVVSYVDTDAARAGRLAKYIKRINPKATHARKLACAIIREGKRHRIDPAVLAAIAHTESWYQVGAKGTWYEAGVWQLWPWARYLRPAYERWTQLQHGPKGLPDKDWDKLTRAEKTRLAIDIEVGTYMAAYLLAHVTRRCRRKDGTMSARCAARYNRPAAPRRGYTWAIRRRVRRIRKALAKP